jgi:hypothetical protein
MAHHIEGKQYHHVNGKAEYSTHTETQAVPALHQQRSQDVLLSDVGAAQAMPGSTVCTAGRQELRNTKPEVF